MINRRAMKRTFLFSELNSKDACRCPLLFKKGIYKIINIVNDKYYVGSTTRTFLKRFNNHKRSLRNNHHCCSKLLFSYNKYGEDKFVCSIVKIIEDDNLVPIEEQKMLTEAINKGLNLNTSIDVFSFMRGRKHTPETIEKIIKGVRLHSKEIGEATRKRQLGTKHSFETIEKMKISAKTRDDSKRLAVLSSKEFSKKQSLLHRGKRSKEFCEIMKKALNKPEHKLRMSIVNTGKVRTENARNNYSLMKLKRKITFKKGSIIEQAISLRHFAKKYNLVHQRLSMLVNGKLTEYDGWAVVT